MHAASLSVQSALEVIEPQSTALERVAPPFPSACAQFYAVVHWMQAVTAALSVIGSSAVIGYAVFQNTARSPEVRPFFYLSLSNLLLGVCWLIGALLYSKELLSQDVACYNVQTTAQIFYVASFLYTVNYTWHLYTDLKGKYLQTLHSPSPPQVLNRGGRIAIILSSVIPLLLMIPVFGGGNHYGCYQNITRKHGCLLMRTDVNGPKMPNCASIAFYSIIVFLVSFAATFLAILVFLIRARALYKRFIISTGYVGDRQWAMIKMVEQGVVLYPVVFLCCWGPAFILGLIELAQVKNNTVYMVFCVLEALTASSQGLLNCAVYAWIQHVSRCLKRKVCRDVNTQTPLLRSQKRFYASTLPAEPLAGPESASAAL
nr:transmembrane protein 116 isoform X1 [Pogona vitticeps]